MTTAAISSLVRIQLIGLDGKMLGLCVRLRECNWQPSTFSRHNVSVDKFSDLQIIYKMAHYKL